MLVIHVMHFVPIEICQIWLFMLIVLLKMNVSCTIYIFHDCKCTHNCCPVAKKKEKRRRSKLHIKPFMDCNLDPPESGGIFC